MTLNEHIMRKSDKLISGRVSGARTIDTVNNVIVNEEFIVAPIAMIFAQKSKAKRVPYSYTYYRECTNKRSMTDILMFHC